MAPTKWFVDKARPTRVDGCSELENQAAKRNEPEFLLGVVLMLLEMMVAVKQGYWVINR